MIWNNTSARRKCWAPTGTIHRSEKVRKRQGPKTLMLTLLVEETVMLISDGVTLGDEHTSTRSQGDKPSTWSQMVQSVDVEIARRRTNLEPRAEKLKVISNWIAQPSAQSTSTIPSGNQKSGTIHRSERMGKRHALLWAGLAVAATDGCWDAATSSSTLFAAAATACGLGAATSPGRSKRSPRTSTWPTIEAGRQPSEFAGLGVPVKVSRFLGRCHFFFLANSDVQIRFRRPTRPGAPGPAREQREPPDHTSTRNRTPGNKARGETQGPKRKSFSFCQQVTSSGRARSPASGTHALAPTPDVQSVAVNTTAA